MKKRIGTKLYDTESAELIAGTIFGDVYRKRTRDREWFVVNGGHIIPMPDAEARSMLGENAYTEKEPDTNSIMVRVDRETHARIAAEAKARGIPIGEVIRRMAENLV